MYWVTRDLICLLSICIYKETYFSNKHNVNKKLQSDSGINNHYLIDSGYVAEVQLVGVLEDLEKRSI